MNGRILLCGVMLGVLSLGGFQAPAQFKDQGMGGGIGFGGTLAQTELKNNQTRFITRAFIRYPMVSRIYGELGASFGRISGVNRTDGSPFTTTLAPIDYRFVISPLALESWAPYLFAGAGALYYDVTEVPSVAGVSKGTLAAKKKGWTMVFPGGLGMLFRMSDQVAFDMNGAFNYTLKEELNGIKNGKKDAFWVFLVGLTYTGESGSADPDNDGLTNDEEKALATNPKAADTDGDGLNDGDEMKKHNTNPTKPDSDADGLSDQEEVVNSRTDPNKPDSDGDGLGDGDELATHKTDPLRADTDGDGLSDGDEINRFKTDPTKTDTDGEGLSDNDEVTKHRTDPLKADTDGGTVNDAVEVSRGTNPLAAADDAPRKEELTIEVGKAIVLEGISFKTGSSSILPESEEILQKAFNTLEQSPEVVVEIQGFTDNTGGRARNIRLSKARADAVKAWLVKQGIDTKRITTKGLGPSNPVAPNTTAEGRARNRRIEFFRIK